MKSSMFYKMITICIVNSVIANIRHTRNQDFPLDLDSIWKYSVDSGTGGPTLGKALPESPVVSEIEALVNGVANLPCNVTSPTKGDQPHLVVLSRGISPIYSIDARYGQDLNEALHWKAGPEFGITASKFLKEATMATFRLEGLSKDAAGDYFCRVDFESSPTSNQKLRLKLTHPPQSIAIKNWKGEELQDIAGPYAVNKTIDLFCHVKGGDPRPNITWILHGNIVHGESQEAKDENTVSKLTLIHLSRDNLGTRIWCQSRNTKLVPPLEVSVTLDIVFPPSNVSIGDHESPFQENVPLTLSCDSTGSRPPAVVSWWKNGFLINDTKHFPINNGNTTRSILVLNPKPTDDGSVLTCRAQNPLFMPTEAIEDSLHLVVYHAPRVSLLPGRRMVMSRITEGDDVYLECQIRSQPPEDTVRWFHQGIEIHLNKKEGIIPSHKNLVLQNIGKYLTGNFTCLAQNELGSSMSNSLQLSVKYAPSCIENQQNIYGGGRNQALNITCSVEAFPLPINFKWFFNSSVEQTPIQSDNIHTEGLTSTVLYGSKRSLEFGSLLCFAENEIGAQANPCIFQVVPALAPESPTNCSVWDEPAKAGEVTVACKPGWDGGLVQKFSLEVRLLYSDDMLAALRNQPVPHFTVTGLAPGSTYILVVHASNSQGSAPPVKVVHITPIDIAEKRLSASTAGSSRTRAVTFECLKHYGNFPMIIILCFVISLLRQKMLFSDVEIQYKYVRRAQYRHHQELCRFRQTST